MDHRSLKYLCTQTIATEAQQKEFIKQCDVCQRNKLSHSKPAGLLKPLPAPLQIWEVISMDFIKGLSNSQLKFAIFIVVDRFFKYGHFTAIKHPYIASQIAQVFFAFFFFFLCGCLGVILPLKSLKGFYFVNKILLCWCDCFMLS
jgi:hypothetical protein